VLKVIDTEKLKNIYDVKNMKRFSFLHFINIYCYKNFKTKVCYDIFIEIVRYLKNSSQFYICFDVLKMTKLYIICMIAFFSVFYDMGT